MSVGYNYEDSLTHGVFRGQLSDFSEKLASLRKDSELTSSRDKYFSGKKWRRVTHFPRKFLDFMRYKIGYDWVILIILGVLMALLSASVDYIIDSLHIARLRIYDHAYKTNVILSVSELPFRFINSHLLFLI